MRSNGSIVRILPAPMSEATCSSTGWWTAGVFLARCTEENTAAQQFWKMPLDGGKPTALTALNPADDRDPRFEDNLGN
jgi:TolB protein